MKTVRFPYGRGFVTHAFDDRELMGVLTSRIGQFDPGCSGEELVKKAMEQPVGSPCLRDLAAGKRKIVIIASDHTRPVPSKLIIPAMLAEIRAGNPAAEITILIATGCHRETSRQELIEKFGAEIVERETIRVHDCDDRENLVNIGILPSGGDCEINKIAMEADLLVAEGFIEPHFFAGFSGGRKSILPGIAGRSTVLSNHCSEFIDSKYARTGILKGNPIHSDMLWAAKTAKLQFIVNVVLNEDKQVIYAVAGDVEKAHADGVRFLTDLCGVETQKADVVVTTNGGYPLDQNVYQAVKGMTAAEAAVRKGGVIIMLAEASDGIGGEHFYHQLADEPDIDRTLAVFRKRGKKETVADQWQTQVFLRVLKHARVIFVSGMDDASVRNMHMIPAHSVGEALQKAREILGMETVGVIAIPDGVSVVMRPTE